MCLKVREISSFSLIPQGFRASYHAWLRFSLFEPETQLIIRGKVPQPVEFGHRILIVEDGAGFVCHYAVLPRGADDREVVVKEMTTLQQRLAGQIRSASFDRGFHSPTNQAELAKLHQQYEARQAQLRGLTRRKEELQTQLRQVEAEIHDIGHGSKLPVSKPAAGGMPASDSRKTVLVAATTGWVLPSPLKPSKV